AVGAALDRAFADPAVQAVAITGGNGLFTGGADIREFGQPAAQRKPTLHELIARIDAAPKPVIAAINGISMGGGTEISLACQYRVAAAQARIGLPEVKIGIIPGAGGTQRLTRAAGGQYLALALEMIVSGEPQPATRLKEAGVVDRVIDGDFLAGVARFAREIAGRTHHPRLADRTIALEDADGFFARARADVNKRFPRLTARGRAVDAIEAAVRRPFAEGLQFEYDTFMALLETTESHALRHAFFAERTATHIADLPKSVAPRKIERVAVIGAGTMGCGIALAFLGAGFAVALIETSAEALQRGLATITGVLDGQVGKGRIDAATRDTTLARLTPSLSLPQIGNADLIIEAVFEELAVKRSVFEALDRFARPGAILATNTSTLDVDAIAAFTRRPADVLGLHFFSPAHVMRLLEVVRGKATAPEVLATAMGLAKKIGKTAVVSRVCDGFIGNRMLEQYLRQAMFLVDEGAAPEAIDAAIEEFGFAMGPFRMSDLAGNDVGWLIRKRRYAESPSIAYSRVADRICEAGRFGQKTGKGWYDYPKGERRGVHSPEAAAIIAAWRVECGAAPRAIAAREIVERLVYALVNEGARILEEGIAQRASDIDVIYLTGYGFPAFRGGPMFHADSVGLAGVVQAMNGFAALAHGDAGFWKPAPLLQQLASQGATFNRP
ncbi:MAG TPA: 3-hydroxyacyl-CoA dehydrogenase NAD-binding domain-containing protein, partial [Usitatibacteraceae bacterium]|nr:3-hydroxyacyl-CoA dehydrogenase NAD-binding domain-containing protein [Usitatibacteraceae bacterium]